VLVRSLRLLPFAAAVVLACLVALAFLLAVVK
jgi:hypothetical protein